MLERYISLTGEVKKKFDLLYDLVINCPVNITTIKDREGFALKHILDSIYFFLNRPPEIKSVADIGSGGGFPGLPLAIYFTDWQVTLVESTGKKCEFLKKAAEALGLSNVRVENSRAEKMPPAGFDLVTARGVGSVKDILKFTSHLVHDKGAWLIYKGERLNEELAEVKPSLEIRGIKNETVRIENPFKRSYLYLYH